MYRHIGEKCGLGNSGALSLTNSTVSGNSANSGGGLSNLGTLALINSTGNSANGSGGGLLNSGTLSLTNSTVSGNSARYYGGVLNASYRTTLTLVRTLVSGNHASSACSTGPEVYNGVSEYEAGVVHADAFNVFGSFGSAGVSGFTPGATDIVPSVPLAAILDPTLTDNGGGTKTHSLVTGSPAIDAVPAASCATASDQRGITRPQDGDGDTVADCDIGAFELERGVLPQIPTVPPNATASCKNLPLPPARCTASRCGVAIKCDGVPGTACNVEVRVFVFARTVQSSDDQAAKAQRRLLFAAGVSNIPAGQIANVRLKLRRAGKQIVRISTRRRIRGVMEIRNSTGAFSSTPVRIRLP